MVKKLLYGLEKKYRILSLLAPLCMVGEVTMEIFIPFLISKIIDVGIPQKDIFYVMKFGGIMVLAACFSLTCGALCGRISSVAALGFSRNLRKNLFKRVQDFSFSNIDEFGTGSLVTRLTTDVTNIQNMYQNLIRTFIRAPLMLLSGSFMAFIISARLAMIFIVIIPLLAVLLIFIALKAYPRFRKMFRKYDELNTVVQENLIAIRVVKSFVRGDFENEKFSNIAEKLRDAQVRAEKIVIWNMPVMQLAIYFCIVASLWSGGNMIYAGSLTSGELISFITYITQILMSLMMLSMIFVQFIFSRASLARIMEVLNEESDIKSPAGNPEKIISDGSVEFKDVYFSYSGDLSKSVLCGVNILIKSGSTVGILGGTGSSKSTFVSMIPRLYDVNKGAVLVGGKDVREYDLDSLRKEIGIVLQKNVLFKGTIAENLRWGNKNASYEDLVNACKIADADSFVSSFPEGYETDLGQGGVNLSGGQKQRLCIARAILKSPKILIMDDSTSACDTATEARILSAMKNSLPETTKIIIAQRISSVQNADFIIVMDGGKINGVGTHDELLKENSIYREVYESQMSKN